MSCCSVIPGGEYFLKCACITRIADVPVQKLSPSNHARLSSSPDCDHLSCSVWSGHLPEKVESIRVSSECANMVNLNAADSASCVLIY